MGANIHAEYQHLTDRSTDKCPVHFLVYMTMSGTTAHQKYIWQGSPSFQSFTCHTDNSISNHCCISGYFASPYKFFTCPRQAGKYFWCTLIIFPFIWLVLLVNVTGILLCYRATVMYLILWTLANDYMVQKLFVEKKFLLIGTTSKFFFKLSKQ